MIITKFLCKIKNMPLLTLKTYFVLPFLSSIKKTLVLTVILIIYVDKCN